MDKGLTRMSAAAAPPTPYAGVNAVLDMVLSGVQTTLGDTFFGMYLHGSLASGDFDPASSDIDLVVVTRDELPPDLLAALNAMHVRIAAAPLPWAKRLEASYIPRQALARYAPAWSRYPAIGEEKPFGLYEHGSDWVIQQHIIRERGVTIAGPPPQSFIEPVLPDDLRRAVRSTLQGWWAPLLDAPSFLHRRMYQSFAILTMCRALYTLRHGTIVSKPVAARWARQVLGERWSALIEQALAERHDPQPDTMNATLDFIRHTLACAEQWG